jgi:DDE superfamily endonuclease
MTNLLTTEGRQYMDWTADYRMYSRERIDCENIFGQIRKEVLALNDKKLLITALDDSLLPKTGKKIPGVKFARDPMGPPFQINFVRGQRVIQMSAAVSEDGQSRMIPVIFRDASTPNKPGRSAPAEAWASYKEDCKARRLSVRGVECIHEMHSQMEKNRALWVAVDGSYTNRTVLNNLPGDTILIGRVRSDAKLYHLPAVSCTTGAGRKRIYGIPAPTPEEIRKDETIPWQPVNAYAAGKVHEFRIKTMKYLRWRASGKQCTLQVMIIAPLRYRLSKASHILYRDPAYLICTDSIIPADKLLQVYLWRWGIETNFRDEKTLLGTGQAQVRNPASVKAVPQMMVASYSLLLLAGIKLWGVKGMPQPCNIPKWQDLNKKNRASTNDLIKQLRSELWADSIASTNLSDFVSKQNASRSLLNIQIPASSAILHVNTG